MSDLIDARSAGPTAAAIGLLALALLGVGAEPVTIGAIAAIAGLAITVAALATGTGALRVPAPAVAVLAVLAALATLSAVSLEWASDDGAGFRDLVLALAYAAVFALLLVFARPGSGGLWIKAIAFSGLGVIVLSLGDRLLGIDGWDREVAASLPAAEERLSGPLGYWNALGSLAALTIPALLWIASESVRPRGRLLAIAAISLPMAAILLAGSRGGALAALLGALVCIGFARDRHALSRLVALAAVIGLAVCGAVALIDDGVGETAERAAAAEPAGSSFEAGLIRGSDSGRLGFWEGALDAFASDPLRGVGAGGYGSWWNEHGDSAVPIDNAHSGPLEVLAELGLPGGLLALALVAIPLLAGIARATAERRRAVAAAPAAPDRAALGPVATALAVFAAAAVGHLFDWTAEIPAAFIPLLIAAMLLTGDALRSEARAAARRPPSAAAATVAALAGAATVWAGIVLAVSSHALGEGRDALAEGRPAEAARQVRAAIEIQPWAAEPRRILAEIELGASNYGAALRQAREAVRLAPDDFRNWHVAAVAGAELDETELAASYEARARQLAPARSNLGGD